MAKVIWHNEHEYEIFKNAFNRNYKSCPCCGGHSYILANGIKQRLFGKERKNVVKIYCNNCGLVFEHVIERFLSDEEKKKLNIK